MLLKRYIWLETVKVFLLITFVLLLIAVSNRFTQLLSRAASGQFPVTAILQVVILIIPELFKEIAPLSTFASVLMAQSSLHANSEIRAMQAAGAGKSILITPTLYFGLIIAIIVLFINLWLMPQLNIVRNNIAKGQQQYALQHMFKPGKFHTFEDGKFIVYINEYTSGNELKDIFVYLKAKDDAPAHIIRAKTAYVEFNNKNEIKLRLFSGAKYTVTSDGMSIIKFKEYGKYFKFDNDRTFEQVSKTTTELWESNNIGDKIELQVRVVSACAMIILALAAIPLAVVNPRSGKFNAILPGIFFCVSYYLVTLVWQRLLIQEVVPLAFGMWMVPILFAGIFGFRLWKM